MYFLEIMTDKTHGGREVPPQKYAGERKRRKEQTMEKKNSKWYSNLKFALQGYSHDFKFDDETERVSVRGKNLPSPELTFDTLEGMDERTLIAVGCIIANMSFIFPS